MSQPITVEKTVTINKSAPELYRFWRDFANLPRFTEHLQDVKVYDAKRSHWTTKAPLGGTVEWDAEITEERENELIVWTSVAGAEVENSGSVQFRPAPPDRGTQVRITVHYNPPAGAAGNAIAKLFGESPKQQIGDDLRHFKMLMETGEIATTDGQPHGRD
jgi:uncharacterized membrane protein